MTESQPSPSYLQPHTDPLNLTNPSIASNGIRQPARRHRTRHSLPRKVSQRIDAAPPQGTTAPKRIKLAVMPQIRRALRVRVRVRASKQVPGVGIQRRHDVLEDIALGHHVAGGDVEGVPGDGVPVVVDGVQQRVSPDLGSAPGGVVDVVALHGDHVVGAGQVDGPVVVAVAGGAPAGGAVELAVGQRHTVGGRLAGDKHLAADEGDLDVVHPD